MTFLNLTGVGSAHVLPGDAIDALAEWGVQWERPSEDRALLRVADDEQLVGVLVHASPGLPREADLDRVRRGDDIPLVITMPRLTPRGAGILRRRGLNAVDVEGNATIRLPGLVIQVEGRRGSADQRSVAPRGRWGPAGVRALLVILARPGMAGDWRVRDLAEASSVSVGSAQTVLARLRRERYLDDDGLHRGGQLLDQWVGDFAADSAAHRVLGRFEYRPAWWHGHEDVLATAGASLGGESAAQAMGLPLRGGTSVMYVAKPSALRDVVKAARLRRDATGGIIARGRWWQSFDATWLAPSPLVYADLLASDEPRQMEVAEELRTADAILRRLDAC